MAEELKCPDCNVNLNRQFRLPAKVYQCPLCKEEYVEKLNGELITKKDWHKQAEEFNA